MSASPSRFRLLRYVAAAAVLAGVIVAGTYVIPASAQVPPIASEPLTSRSIFTDDITLMLKIKRDGRETEVVKVDDPSRTVVVRYTVQPGAQFPWHSHAGPVVVNLISGALTYLGAEDCLQRTYTAGEAFVDPGQGHVHTAFNLTTEPTVFIATFFDAPADGSLLIPAAPSCM